MSTFERHLRVLTDPLNMKNDAAHNMKHVDGVLKYARLANEMLGNKINDNLITAAALCHDIGCSISREKHHEISAMWLVAARHSKPIKSLTLYELMTVRRAILNHRSSSNVPEAELTPLCRILRVADMGPMDVHESISRAYAYRRDNSNCTKEEAYIGAVTHIKSKYGSRKVSALWTKVFGEYPRQEIMSMSVHPCEDTISMMEAEYIDNIK